MAKRKVYFSPAFGRKLKKLKKPDKQALDDTVLDILNHPQIGTEKAGDLAGVFVYKFKLNKQLTLLSYTFDDDSIHLLTFASHENFYRDLKNYRKS